MKSIYISHISALNIHRWWRLNNAPKLNYNQNFKYVIGTNSIARKQFFDWYKNLFKNKLDIIVKDKNKAFFSSDTKFLYTQIKYPIIHLQRLKKIYW